MKISCTKGEKEVLIQILTREVDLCPFEEGFGVCYGFGHCKECIEKTIEWDVKGGDGDG